MSFEEDNFGQSNYEIFSSGLKQMSISNDVYSICDRFIFYNQLPNMNFLYNNIGVLCFN